MNSLSSSLRPTLLLLCHVFPDAAGTPPQQRAWQWLQAASRTHRVFLACLARQPVHLDQWREVFALVEQVALERPTWHGTWLSWAWRLIDAPAAEQWLQTPTLGCAVQTWLSRMLNFDAVVWTHPALARLAARVDARHHLGDLNVPDSLVLRREIHAPGYFAPWRHRRTWLAWCQQEYKAARMCDLVVLADEEAAYPLRGLPCRVITLRTPELGGFDLGAVAARSQVAAPPRPPRLAILPPAAMARAA